jgi:NAD(P)H-dependent FMN reductase
MSITISILYGSVRTDRQGIKAAKYLEKLLKERDVLVHFIDPKEFVLPLLDKMYKEYAPGTAPAKMEKLAGILNESEAFLIVTGEYNHSIPPALKNMLDHFQREYYFKPSAIASYSAGSFGGVRAAVHLRVILGELGTLAISSMLPFPVIGTAFNDDLEPLNSRTVESASRFLDELLWYTEAFKNQRVGGTPY